MADIDPSKDPQGAYRWAMARLEDLRDRQLELEALFFALGQQITWGVIRCNDVIAYNMTATSLFNASVDFFTWFKPAADEIQRQTGIAVFPMTEVPLPQLIGTKYLVFDRGAGHKAFDAGVVCDAAGNFSPMTPRDQIQLGPQAAVSTCLSGPMNGSITMQAPRGTAWLYPTTTDLRHEFGLALPAAGKQGWAAIALAAIGLIALIYVYKIVQRVLGFFDGTRAQELENESQSKVIEAGLGRAECLNTNFVSLGGPTIPDQVAREALWAKVVAVCEKVIPQTSVIRSKWWRGLAGLLAVGGVVTVGVLVAKGRNQRSRSDDEG